MAALNTPRQRGGRPRRAHRSAGPSGPRVTEIIAVEDLTAGPDAAQFTATELFGRTGPHAELVSTGNLPIRAGARLERAGHDVRALLGTPGEVAT